MIAVFIERRCRSNDDNNVLSDRIVDYIPASNDSNDLFDLFAHIRQRNGMLDSWYVKFIEDEGSEHEVGG